MSEYIESKCGSCVHLEACAAWIRHGSTLYSDFSYSVEDCPYYIPAADVAPVVHGRWERTVENWVACSICGDEWNGDVVPYEEFKFCPNCGKIMDGDNQ